jgi:6-phosphogluconolactonase
LQETSRWVVANWVSKFESNRLTMTFPVLDSAAEVILFVAGPEKAALVAEILQRGADAQKYPVQLVRPRDGIKRWMLDGSAAARIDKFQSEAIPK